MIRGWVATILVQDVAMSLEEHEPCQNSFTFSFGQAAAVTIPRHLTIYGLGWRSDRQDFSLAKALNRGVVEEAGRESGQAARLSC